MLPQLKTFANRLLSAVVGVSRGAVDDDEVNFGEGVDFPDDDEEDEGEGREDEEDDYEDDEDESACREAFESLMNEMLEEVNELDQEARIEELKAGEAEGELAWGALCQEFLLQLERDRSRREKEELEERESELRLACWLASTMEVDDDDAVFGSDDPMDVDDDEEVFGDDDPMDLSW